MTIQIIVPAGADSTFASGAWDSVIGSTFACELPDGTPDTLGRLVDAEVTADGEHAVLTIEVPV